jgi:hypothetical protein
MPRTVDPHDNWVNGTRVAVGRYIKLVCADDLLRRHCLEQQVEAMDAHPDAVMVASRRSVIATTGDILVHSWGLPGMLGELDGTTAVRRSVRSGTNTFGEPACVLLRRTTLAEVGGWDGTFPYVLDHHTYSKALMHGTFVGLAEPLASFRLSDSQWSKALAKAQYGQIVDFHRALANMFPDLLSRADLANGRWRAWVLASARRLTYRVLARKLRTQRATLENAPSARLAAAASTAIAGTK